MCEYACVQVCVEIETNIPWASNTSLSQDKGSHWPAVSCIDCISWPTCPGICLPNAGKPVPRHPGLALLTREFQGVNSGPVPRHPALALLTRGFQGVKSGPQLHSQHCIHSPQPDTFRLCRVSKEHGRSHAHNRRKAKHTENQ